MSLRHAIAGGTAAFAAALFGMSVHASASTPAPSAAQITPMLYQDMRWRLIGPFRGGRTVAASGIGGEPNVAYIGVNDGGVWRTNDFGQTWFPIFDGQPSGSIGALAIAPSDPNVIYVGSGEGLRRPDLSVGDGMYKSTDGGRTWTHLGLRDGQQIGAIVVDPTDADRLYVAVLGHPFGPNPERGVYRSIDGGASWQRVLYKNDDTGAIDLAMDPSNPRTIYASLWVSRRSPWYLGPEMEAPGSGLFVSHDGGDSWQQLHGGLPGDAQGVGRIGIAIAPSEPGRMYAWVQADQTHTGIYRSDDAGATWKLVDSEDRIVGRGDDFACVRVDPRDPDRIYVANTSTYRSDDGGVTFTAIKGAPGGDDYHTVWINPLNPGIILIASDQGATMSVNGGATWSSWYNQPTAQFYHVITDDRFPYWVYGGQQESGSAGVVSRSDYGEITFRDWHPVGVEEWGYVAPDPLDPDIIYGGKVTRFDQRTGEWQDVSPVVRRSKQYRFDRTAPLAFSPIDPHLLVLGSNVVFTTRNGGHSWQVISPDLTRPNPGVPDTIRTFWHKAAPRAVIYSLGLSQFSARHMWAGTNDGLVWQTLDGGAHWSDVTPPGISQWSKVSSLDASHFDDRTVYVAVSRFALDDLRPYAYKTHDGGKTWESIGAGLPSDAPVDVVREDPKRPGLLYAGTEHSVYVSFDDGARWLPLTLNLPITSMRDLTVHGDDLVVATHGRSFWILDDLTPLRQISAHVAQAHAALFAPETTYRMRSHEYTDTPLPPEVPAGQNPPDGAILDYMLGARASGVVALEIRDARGGLVRRYESTDRPPVFTNGLDVPTYWIRPPSAPSVQPGMHRFVWDLRYTPPHAFTHDYPISAIVGDTPPQPAGVLALPGRYEVRLIVDGKTYLQPLTIVMDPRCRATQADLRAEFDVATQLIDLLNRSYVPALRQINDQANGLLNAIDRADAAPTEQQLAAIADLSKRLNQSLSKH